MSNHVTSLLRRRHLGVGFPAKSLLLLMGDIASDDGTGIYASKARMARELETTDRTVQRKIQELITAGFVVEVGKKKHRNGETYEYMIDVKRVADCPHNSPTPPTGGRVSAQDVDQPPQDVGATHSHPPTQCHPTPDTVSPHEVLTPDTPSPDPRQTVTQTQLNPREAVAASAREAADLLTEVLAAVGLKNGTIPTHWMPPAATLHVNRWRTDLGLTDQEILETARNSRARHADPPNGPKALDRVMQQLAGAKSAPELAPATNRRSQDGQRFDDAMRELANGLSEGSVHIETRSRDPFAS